MMPLSVSRKRAHKIVLAVWLIILLSIHEAESVDVVADPVAYKEVYPPIGDDVEGIEPLYIVLLMSFGGDFTSSGVIPGVQVALDQINSDPTLLPGYTLHYTLRDSQCQRTVALDSFFAEIVQEPTKIAMIGAGCSVATEPTAEVSQYYNIIQISCASASPALLDRDRFRSYFQILASEDTLAGGFYGIVREFGWKKVGIITQNENVFTLTMLTLKKILDENDVSYTESVFLTNDSVGDIKFEPGVRIFIVAMYSYHARFLICKAYNEGLRYPKYLFLLYGWYEENWWVGDPSEDMLYNCSKEDRETVLEYSLAVLVDEFITDDSTIADTGINGEEFYERYQFHLGNSSFVLTESMYSQSCYDATWALAYALNNTLTEINNNIILDETLAGSANNENETNETEVFQLNNFTYKDELLRNVIATHLDQTSFIGITGSVQFRNSSRKNVTVQQYRRETDEEDLQLVTTGTVVEDTVPGQFKFIFADGVEDSIWRDGIIPYDGVPVEIDVHASLALAVIIYILAAAGVVFTIVCLVFNFVFRQRKLIRLSSPNLNYLIGAGAIILYIDICFFPVPSTDPTVVSVACNLTPWLTALGYSLCYGTIVVKMCRVYYLFHDPLTKKKNITDWMLALAVLSLCVVDLIILVLYTAIEGAGGNLEAERQANTENPRDIEGEINFIREFYTYICDSQARDIFLGILYGYKAALQIVALVLSFGIRKVKVKGLDDSKYIAAAVYVTSIVLAVVIVATYTLKDFVTGFPALVSIGFFIGTTFILVLVFIPKMAGLYRDPHGESVFSKSELSETTDTIGTRKLSTPLSTQESNLIAVDKTEVEDLKKRLKELESFANREVELESHTNKEAELESHTNKEVELESHTNKEVELESHTNKEVELESHTNKEAELESFANGEVELETFTNREAELESHTNKEVELESHTNKEVELESFTNREAILNSKEVDENETTQTDTSRVISEEEEKLISDGQSFSTKDESVSGDGFVNLGADISLQISDED